MDSKKTQFIYDKLFPWYIDKLREPYSDNSLKADFAALKIFPYKTSHGVQYGSLNESDVHWYYVSSDEFSKEVSNSGYRILATNVFPERNRADLISGLKAAYDGKLLRPFSSGSIINDIIEQMSKETSLTQKWWNCAYELFTRWDGKDPGEKYVDAYKSISTSEILIDANYCDEKHQKLLFELHLFNDTFHSDGYHSYIQSIPRDKISKGNEFLFHLGIPTKFVDEYNHPHHGLIDLFDRVGKNVKYPAPECDSSEYQLAELCSYIVFHSLHSTERLGLLSDYSRIIPIKNRLNQYIPIYYNLFSAPEYELSEPFYGPVLDELLVSNDDSEVDYSTLSCVYSIDTIGDFDYNDFRFCLFQPQSPFKLYRWAWNYTHSQSLIGNILPLFNSIDSTNAAFAFSVLQETIALCPRLLDDKKILLCASDSLLLKNAELINRLSRLEKCKFKAKRFGSTKLELLNTEQIKHHVLQLALQQYLSVQEIDKASFWTQIYISNDVLFSASDSLSPTYAIVYSEFEVENFGLLLPRSDEETYILTIGKFIQDQYGYAIANLTTDWEKEYTYLAHRIQSFIKKPRAPIPLFDLNEDVDLANVQTFGDEKRIWSELQQEYQDAKNGRQPGKYVAKEFLNMNYKGICQVCGTRTPEGIADQKNYFFTYRIVKPHESQLADLLPNLFCLCPSCHGKIRYSCMGRDISSIYKSALEYVEEYTSSVQGECPDDMESVVSEYATMNFDKYNVRSPIVCNVTVNGDDYDMVFSWSHFIRIAFILTQVE